MPAPRRRRGGRGRRLETGPRLGAGPHVVADDANAPPLGGEDVLARLLGDSRQQGGVVGAGRDRDADAVARRPDLLDLVEAEAGEERGEATAGRDLGVGEDRVEAGVARPRGDRRETPGHDLGPRARRDRPPGDVEPPAADEAPRPAQGEHRRAVVEDQVMPPPAGPLAVHGPGQRLLHVTPGHVHGERIPARELVGRRLAHHPERRDPARAAARPRASALPRAGVHPHPHPSSVPPGAAIPDVATAVPGPSPARALAHRTRARWAVS